MKEEKQMQKKGRKITATLVLISMLIGGNLMPQNGLQVQAATTAKKTVKITLDAKHSEKYVKLTTVPKTVEYTTEEAYERDVKRNRVQIKIQILSLKGKPKKKRISDFELKGEIGKAYYLLNEMSSKKYKKGTIYSESKNDEFIHVGSLGINITLPKGVKKVTYNITFSNASGRRTLKDIKVKNKCIFLGYD